MHQIPVDVCKCRSKQARYPQNISFVPRRFSRRYALPARRLNHALCVTFRTFWFTTVSDWSSNYLLVRVEMLSSAFANCLNKRVTP